MSVLRSDWVDPAMVHPAFGGLRAAFSQVAQASFPPIAGSIKSKTTAAEESQVLVSAYACG